MSSSPLLSIQDRQDRGSERTVGEKPLARFSPKNIMARKPVYVASIVVFFLVSLLIIIVAIHNWKVGFSADLVLWQRKGLTLTNGKYCTWVKYDDDRAVVSLKSLQSTGADWVQIVVTQYQTTANSTKIQAGAATASDSALESIIATAVGMNMKVALVLQIDLPNYEARNARRRIGQHFTNKTWGVWFESYTTVVLHYATLAEKSAVSLFSVGYELPYASQQAGRWTPLIAAVRKVYSNALTYAAVSGGEETAISWWGLLDVIGVQAFYEFKDTDSPGKLSDQWSRIIDVGVDDMTMGLKKLASSTNKTVLFTGIGYCSGACPTNPEGEVDLTRQENLYEAALVALGYAPWFNGAFFFNWDTDPGFGGQDNYCMTPQGKPAEQVLRDYFGATTAMPQWNAKAECPCILD